MKTNLKTFHSQNNEAFADTSFIQEIIPFRNADPMLRKMLGYEFKPQANFSDVRDSSFRFKHSYNKWLAEKYEFRTTNLVISEEYKTLSLDWDLRDGVHLATQTMNPATLEIADDDSKNLYLLFLYRKRGEWNGANALKKLKEFLRHLEAMPLNPVQNVFLRATGIEQHNWKHLEKLEYIPEEKATSERLLKVYRKILGCTDWKYLDVDGLPYQKVKYRPQNPKY